MLSQNDYRDLINRKLRTLAAQLANVTDSAAIVELDQSRVGRLSRMDALQAQAMHTESLARAKSQMIALQHALKRLDTDEYGECVQCFEPLAPARLQLKPAVTLCITCAEKKEQS